MKVIHMISGPRNLSTAIMYSFNNRKDCVCVDEPYYANYLSNVEIEHPGKKEILSSLPIREENVPKCWEEKDTAIVFIKNMAQHLRKGMSLEFMRDMQNFLLIRHPKQLIASFAEVIPHPTLRDIGLKRSYEILNWLKEQNLHVFVLDSGDLLDDPKEILIKMCQNLNIPFDENMLHWESGPKAIDGVWAPYWYANVHKSTGFQKQRSSDRPLSTHCQDLYQEAIQYYNELRKFAITKD